MHGDSHDVIHVKIWREIMRFQVDIIYHHLSSWTRLKCWISGIYPWMWRQEHSWIYSFLPQIKDMHVCEWVLVCPAIDWQPTMGLLVPPVPWDSDIESEWETVCVCLFPCFYPPSRKKTRHTEGGETSFWLIIHNSVCSLSHEMCCSWMYKVSPHNTRWHEKIYIQYHAWDSCFWLQKEKENMYGKYTFSVHTSCSWMLFSNVPVVWKLHNV